MNRALSILIILIALSGCGSSLTLPPEKEQLQSLAKASANNPDWKVNQSQAYSFLKGKCPALEALSLDKTFPLWFLALRKTFEKCNYSPEQLEKRWSQLPSIPSWAAEDFNKRMELVARKNQLKKMQAHFLVQMSKPIVIPKEKTQLMQRAIKLDPKNQSYRKRLYKLAPRFSKRVNRSNIYAVARDFEKAREFKKARGYYQKIIKQKKYSFALKIKAFNRYRTSFKVERNLDEFILQTEAMVRFIGKKRSGSPKNEEFKKAYTTSMIDWARAVWTDHRRGEAREKLTRLINSKIEDPENEALIYWLLGVMAIEGKKHRLALDHFEKGNTFDIEDTDLKEKIHWAIGWTYYLQKDYKKAAGFFDTTYHQYDAGGFRNKLHFWAGRSYKKAGESSKATNTWEELLSVDSYGYYGILTHMELGKPLSPLDPGKDQSKNPEIEILEWLIALKETKLSHAFLKSFQKTLVSPSAIKDHLNLFKKAGYYEGGIKNFFKLKGEDRERAMRSHLGSAFPRPYKRSVNRAARKFKISPYLIYSISRQESAFNPSIRSWADAFGVMQMTPERAVILSKRHRVPYNKVGDLFHPKTNILLGTSLLRELKNKFQNKFIATVAGYNASERVVKVWYRQRYNGDPIQFIEMIPYKETQNYVKLVFRNFITYKRLESKDQFLVKSDIFKKF